MPLAIRSRSRSRCSGVVSEQPTETWVSTHSTDMPFCRLALDQFVVQSLMIPLAMIVSDKFPDSPPVMVLAKRDHAVQTFLFDRSDEPFGVGVGIGRPDLRQAWANPSRCGHGNPRIDPTDGGGKSQLGLDAHPRCPQDPRARDDRGDLTERLTAQPVGSRSKLPPVVIGGPEAPSTHLPP